jgi:DNA-directed RNA polymerase subunit omega
MMWRSIADGAAIPQEMEKPTLAHVKAALCANLLLNARRQDTINAMARITVEDCLSEINSRFELVILAAKRAKQLLKGAKPLLASDNRAIVVALREIAAGKVRRAAPEPDALPVAPERT